MKVLRNGLAVAVAAYLTGCASIVSDNKRIVSLDSVPTGATVTVTNKAGLTVFTGSTPTAVTLKTSSGFFSGEDYQVTFAADGRDPVSTQISRSVNGWYFGNILFGGLIGMLIVDPMTGAMWTLEEDVSIDLTTGARFERPAAGKENMAPAKAKSGETLGVITIDQLPQEYHAFLVPVAGR